MNYKRLLGVLIMFVLLSGCRMSSNDNEIVTSSTPNFDHLPRITLEELDLAIAREENMYLYIGWTKNSKECVNFQEKFLEPNIEYYQWNGLISVLDLDIELPNSLENKDEREILINNYEVPYAPAIIFIKKGEIISRLMWSPEDNDLSVGIPMDKAFAWMREVDLIR